MALWSFLCWTVCMSFKVQGPLLQDQICQASQGTSVFQSVFQTLLTSVAFLFCFLFWKLRSPDVASPGLASPILFSRLKTSWQTRCPMWFEAFEIMKEDWWIFKTVCFLATYNLHEIKCVLSCCGYLVFPCCLRPGHQKTNTGLSQATVCSSCTLGVPRGYCNALQLDKFCWQVESHFNHMAMGQNENP